MSSSLVLYGYWRSSSAYRVRIVLALKGLNYEYKAIHLRKGEQKSPEFTAISPNQTVPVLVADGHPISQSLAIIEFLEDTHPSPSVYPKDPYARAQARAVASLIGSDIQPLQNLRTLTSLFTQQADKDAHAKQVINDGFVRLEKMLQKSAGKCCVGDEVSVADAFLVPQVYNAVRYNVDLEQFPIIKRVNEYLVTLEPFKVSAPEVQPDAGS